MVKSPRKSGLNPGFCKILSPVFRQFCWREPRKAWEARKGIGRQRPEGGKYGRAQPRRCAIFAERRGGAVGKGAGEEASDPEIGPFSLIFPRMARVAYGLLNGHNDLLQK
jgi:hypothetical protein